MDEIYENIVRSSKQNIHGNKSIVDCDFTEIWRDDSSGNLSINEGSYTNVELEQRLGELTRTECGAAQKTLVLRFLWIQLDPLTQVAGQTDHCLRLILDAFGLQLAFRYFSTCFAGITGFPKSVTKTHERQSYSLTYAPKLAAIWSHSREALAAAPGRDVTQGVIFTHDDKKKKALRQLLTAPWDASLTTDALFPVFLFSLLMLNEINAEIKPAIGLVGSVEARTGHQSFKTVRPPAEEDLAQLSAHMSGLASKLASCERKSVMIEAMIRFIYQADEQGGSSSEPPTHSLMNNHVSVLHQRLKMQVAEINFLLKRVKLQTEALVNLISQSIALSSRHDASAMRTLAFVTMVFLPGSFVSAIFSTNVFNWNEIDLTRRAIGVEITPQFWLYWAITIPMTLLTFLAYMLWLWYQDYTTNRTPVDRDLARFQQRALTGRTDGH